MPDTSRGYDIGLSASPVEGPGIENAPALPQEVELLQRFDRASMAAG